MTSAVTERGTIMNLAVQAAPAKPGTSDTGFTQVMDKAVSANKSADASESAAGKRGTAKADDKASPDGREHLKAEETRGTDRTQQEKPDAVNSEQAQQTDKTVNAENDVNEAGEEAAASEAARLFMEKAEQVLTQAAENLSVSVEDVTEMMKELGMELTDLLDPDRMTELLMMFTGEDQTSLLTNEALYNTMQELTALSKDAGDELMKELSLTPEDLKAMLEQIAEAQKAGEEADDMLSGMQKGADLVSPDNTDERASGLTSGEMREQTNLTQQTDISAMTDSTKNGMQQTEAQMTAGRQEGGDSAQTGENGDSLMDGGQGFAEHLMNRTNEFTEILTQGQDMPGTYADAEQIMKQITDFIRTHVNAQGSSVELQLHPASLGTLNIAITAKNGIVTAQFTAQDEAVRAVLESQVTELRSRLDEQGVKVEAIEVTVSSHEFERNLEQNADQDADERGEAQAKRRTTRRLNLDMPGEGDAEELDDAEQIARDMMRIHGNRLDYLA